MIEVTEEELDAVRNWNCGMLIKKKQRALLCRSFLKWKDMFLSVINNKCEKIQYEIEQKSTMAKRLTITTHGESSQSISQLQATNQQLQRELEQLKQEQAEIEKATSKIRETLKTLHVPSTSFSSTSSKSRSQTAGSRSMTHARYF